MEHNYSDIIFKHRPPSIDHPGYNDWKERMFQLGYDDPYDAYLGIPPSRLVSTATVAIGSGIVAGMMVEGKIETKIAVGATVGLLAGLLGYLSGEW